MADSASRTRLVGATVMACGFASIIIESALLIPLELFSDSLISVGRMNVTETVGVTQRAVGFETGAALEMQV